MKKKVLSLTLAIVFCLSLMLAASAVSVSEEPVRNLNVVSTDSYPLMPISGAARAFAGGTISGGYGEISCTLGRYLSEGSMQATVTSNTASGTITCFVEFPNGAIQYLGTVPASGGSTPKEPMYTLESGVYTFIFEATSAATFHVSGCIFDWYLLGLMDL